MPEYINDPQQILAAGQRQMEYLQSFLGGPEAADAERLLGELLHAQGQLLSAASRAMAAPQPAISPTAVLPTFNPRLGDAEVLDALPAPQPRYELPNPAKPAAEVNAPYSRKPDFTVWMIGGCLAGGLLLALIGYAVSRPAPVTAAKPIAPPAAQAVDQPAAPISPTPAPQSLPPKMSQGAPSSAWASGAAPQPKPTAPPVTQAAPPAISGPSRDELLAMNRGGSAGAPLPAPSAPGNPLPPFGKLPPTSVPRYSPPNSTLPNPLPQPREFGPFLSSTPPVLSFPELIDRSSTRIFALPADNQEPLELTLDSSSADLKEGQSFALKPQTSGEFPTWLLEFLSDAQAVVLARLTQQPGGVCWEWSKHVTSAIAVQLWDCVVEAKRGGETVRFALRAAKEAAPLIIDLAADMKTTLPVAAALNKKRVYLELDPDSIPSSLKLAGSPAMPWAKTPCSPASTILPSKFACA